MSRLLTSVQYFKEKKVRHPALVEQQEVLPPGQVQHQQEAGQEGDGHAGRHQSRIFRCGIYLPVSRCVADYCFDYLTNVKYKSFCA